MFAVNWHRFVLLEEYPRSWTPSVHTGRILYYFGTGIAMSLLCCLVVFPVLLLQVFVLANGSLTGAMVGLTAITLVSMYMFYRVAVMLPASAIGKPLTISDAFAATRKASGDIIVLVVANTVLQLAFSQGGSVLVWAGFPILGSVWIAAASIVLPVLKLSILTTAYGHYVEGRPISD